MKATNKKISLCIIAAIFIILASIGLFYNNMPNNPMFPPSNELNSTGENKVEISSFNSNLLNGIVSLVALAVTFTAFVIPFTVLVIGSLQKSYFETMLHAKSLSEEGMKNAQKLEEAINKKISYSAAIYGIMMIFSIISLGCVLVYLLYFISYDNMLQYFWFFLALEITCLIILFFAISTLFVVGERPFPLLAKIQKEIINNLKTEEINDIKNGETNEKQQDMHSITEKNINLNVTFKIRDNQNDEKKE